ncbi:MAG: fumarate reductase/succinate dehydrogenase flavoprotein subunit, partial [Desulfobulbaceae bacterium]|nr:fumarate reductase/succinate dehydrogenase flavoprotein subunit [Desulfobulbaceae bacterium]
SSGLQKALALIPQIREEFWNNVLIPGTGKQLNQSLERAGRLADFLEFAELMVTDALDREESCGCHLREESQTEENEAKRDDEKYAYVSAWEYQGAEKTPILHKEPLTFEYVTPSQRSYK